MMRSPNSLAIAVRRKDGRIVIREDHWLSFSERLPFLKWPILRGATMLVESMFNGVQALNFSASQAMEDEENPDEPSSNTTGHGTVGTSPEDDKKGNWALGATVAFSLALSFLIFKGVPHLATMFFGFNPASGSFHLVDGAIKLAFFVGYIVLISRMDEVKRLFMYHGAEHKSVHTYEGKEDLVVKTTLPQSTAHPRCGTTLILLVITVSVFVFALFIPFVPVVSSNSWLQGLFALFVKIPLMFPVAGVAYEVQRFAAKNPDASWVNLIVRPGMLMQRLTTREPDPKQIEVALAALRQTLWREIEVQDPNRGASNPAFEKELMREYASFEDFELSNNVHSSMLNTTPSM